MLEKERPEQDSNTNFTLLASSLHTSSFHGDGVVVVGVVVDVVVEVVAKKGEYGF